MSLRTDTVPSGESDPTGRTRLSREARAYLAMPLQPSSWRAGRSAFAEPERSTRQAREARAHVAEHVRRLGLRLRRHLPQIASSRTADAAVSATGTARNGAGSIEERLLQRMSFGWSQEFQQEAERVGWRAVLEQQLQPELIPDGGLEQLLLDVLPSLGMTPWERLEAYPDDLRGVPIIEIALAVFVRALYSPRQLFERTVELWNDHFHTAQEADFGPYFKPDYDFGIRRWAFGSFRQVLGASARSASMMDYLTNNTNIKDFPNENYARELMELHTLGVDNGYTQQDVREVARAFTGWTFYDPRKNIETFGQFHFVRPIHDTAPKTVLGRTLPAGRGVQDGEQVLDILANHPNTARFVARKMLVQFWGYQPSERQIEAVAQVYSDTNGDVRAMLRQTLSWYDMTTAPPKLKRPFHLLTSAMRALAAELEDIEDAFVWLFDIGHFPFYWGPPNGYPDSLTYWSGAPLKRWNFANGILFGERGAALSHPAFAESHSPEEFLEVLNRLLFAGSMSATITDTLRGFLAQRPWNESTRKEVAGLAVASNDFQYY